MHLGASVGAAVTAPPHVWSVLKQPQFGFAVLVASTSFLQEAGPSGTALRQEAGAAGGAAMTLAFVRQHELHMLLTNDGGKPCIFFEGRPVVKHFMQSYALVY